MIDATPRPAKQREPLNIEDLDPLEGAWRRQQEERVMITAGTLLQIAPPYRDDGDEEFYWVAVEDEDGGRVKIRLVDNSMPIPATQVVRVDQVMRAKLSAIQIRPAATAS